jgi:formylglycine-generating enzyme required for sulfatase activity
MTALRVFVSHDSHDNGFARALVAALRDAGADVWLDERDLSWHALRDEIDRELPTRPYFVVVLSPDALASAQVSLAIDIARELRGTKEVRACVAVLARPCPVPSSLSDFQILNGTSGLAAIHSALLDALGLSLGVAPSDEVALVPASQLPHAQAHARTPTVLPPRLQQLGYQGWQMGDTDIILPPLSLVPGGPFVMGSDEEPSEAPRHTVALSPYAIMTYPIIVAEYACFVRAGHPLPRDVGRITWSMQFARLDHPVVNVSWSDAVAYAAWLSQWTGQFWRLPTEAEWEKAACWDPATRSPRVYPWGNTFDSERCNTRESSISATTPVGMYPNGASPCGAQDLAGNVREWTHSLYAPYPYDPTDGRERHDARGERVQRGGSWFGFASDARAAFRDWHAPDDVSSVVGFRLVLDAPAGPR